MKNTLRILAGIVVLLLFIVACVFAFTRHVSTPTNRDSKTAQTGQITVMQAWAAPMTIIGSTSTSSLYQIKGDSVYYDGNLIKGADASSFTIFNKKDAKDKNHVYSYGDINSDYDPQTFVSLDSDGNYVEDKSGVYYDGMVEYAGLEGHTKLESADPATFVYLSGPYSKDKNHVYNLTDIMEGADPSTFQVLQDADNSSIYQKDKNTVYFYGKPISGPNPQTFIPIVADFGTDGLNLYHDYMPVAGWIPDNITVLFPQYPVYIKDSHHVYMSEGGDEGDPTIVGADPATFTIITSQYGPSGYSKDRTHVFYERQMIEGADPVTFTYIGLDPNDGSGGYYAKDKNAVYVNGEVVANTNPNTFVLPQ